ncbi:CMP-N-acetylneuraminate-poly-alpha-2,8-sialyltransferase-like isoform X2 [Saccoglossus kowalevskii]|nr:PREDICTED: CMP-N-acetylneuraminate-poly-alpha-2,8-sialyltransferase-like isoform X2 [Saccoglossus kowalevskii]
MSCFKMKRHLPPCTRCPTGLRNCESLADLRNYFSQYIDLKKTIAIYKDQNKLDRRCCPQKLNFGTESETYMEMVKDFYTIEQQKSCAIVGNGGILTHSGCGSEIDQHDFVMRLNLAPVSGYEKDVGGKTNFTAVNNVIIHRFYENIQKRNQKMHRYVNQLKDLKDSILWFGYNKSAKVPAMGNANNKMQTILRTTKMNPSKMKYQLAYSIVPVWPTIISRAWNTSQGTSEGYIVFTLATLFCDKIDLYGFWPFHIGPQGNPVSHHYYDQRSRYTKKKQTMPNENKVLLELNRREIIRWVTSPCVTSKHNQSLNS